MAEALEIRVRDLLPEFLADALILFCTFQSAGTVTAGTFQTVTDHLHHSSGKPLQPAQCTGAGLYHPCGNSHLRLQTVPSGKKIEKTRK